MWSVNVFQNESSDKDSPNPETSEHNGNQMVDSPQRDRGDGQNLGLPQAASTPVKSDDQSASPAIGQLVDIPLQEEGTPNSTTDVRKEFWNSKYFFLYYSLCQRHFDKLA